MGFSHTPAVASAIALMAACSSYSGGDAAPPPPPAPSPSPAPDASVAPTTVYVSVAGDDTHAGTDPSAPLKTIAFGLSRAKAIGVHEVRICAGLYDEPSLVLDAPISVRGGFDCTSWRRPDGFGYPGFANGLDETRITKSGSDADAVTFSIVGEAVTRDTHIEGLTVDGPSAGVRGTALRIGGKAAPSVHDLVVRGGQTAATTAATGSIGIGVVEGASPEIMHARISGGLGTTTDVTAGGYGAVGVQIADASPALHDATINASEVPSAAAGIFITGAAKLTGPSALAHLTIATSSAAVLFSGISSIGKDAELEIVGSTIDGSVVTCTPDGLCAAVGVNVLDAARVLLSGNRIVGAEISAARTAAASTQSVAVARIGTLAIVNNVIDSGNGQARDNVFSFGVNLTEVASVHVTENTFSVAPTGNAAGVYVSSKASAAALEGNLFVSPGAGVGFVVDECAGGSVAALTANAFVGLSFIGSVLRQGQCGSFIGLKNFKDVQQRFPSATRNVRVMPRASCNEADDGCLEPAGCNASDLCAASVLDGWTAPARAGLLSGVAKLVPTAPCAIAKGVAPLFSNAASDLFGAPRTEPASIGAAEDDSDACAP